METLILFLSRSIFISTLLTAWYVLALRGRKLHQYNRFFLLSVLFFSLAIPFLHFHLFTIPHKVSGVFAPVVLLSHPADLSNSLPAASVVAQAGIDWLLVAGIAVGCISIILLTILTVRILRVKQMYRQYPVTKYQGVNLVLTDSPKAPFTFLKYIFWNRSLSLDDETGQLIFRHELTHIAQGHSYDKLACQVLTCIFWFNPLYWIIQKELNIVHEFIADDNAVRDNDTDAFARMLLQSYSNGSFLVPEHHFFSSSVKRRLAMLQTSVQPSYTALRRFMAVPLIAGSILLFSFGMRSATPADITPAAKRIVVLLDAAHGGLDAGAHSGDYVEKDICLKYAKRIKELSAGTNVDVQLVRNDDRYVVLSGRAAIANKINPGLFISLHVDDAPGKDKAKGDFEIYVSGENRNVKQSNNYSSSIFQAMAQNNIIPGSATGNVAHKKGCTCSSCTNSGILPTDKESFYMLQHVQSPAMVLVLGNIKNSAEMKELSDDSRMDMVCRSILQGIADGAAKENDFKGSTFDLLSPDQDKAKCY